MNKQEIREKLTGPITSVRPPFHKDGTIDYKGLRRYIDHLLDTGARTMLLTSGDSHYLCLGDDEIVEVTKVTIEQVAGRAMVVAADRYYSTDRAVEFAKFAKEAGADILMCQPPDWTDSCTAELLTEHYATVSKVMPVMIVTNVFIPRGIDFGMKTLELALEKAPNVVAVKDDMCNDFARKMALHFHEHWAVISGGQKQNHMDILPFGCDGYLSTFITFKPEVTHEYWQAAEAGDISKACAIIKKYDIPYFDFISSLEGGFDAGIHGTYELFGIYPRWRRPPYHSLTDEQMARLKAFLQQLGVM